MSTLKVSSVLLVAALLAACAGVTPKPFSPCPGLYCIEVEIPGVPGSPTLCYASAASRDEAVAKFTSEGKKVKVY